MLKLNLAAFEGSVVKALEPAIEKEVYAWIHALLNVNMFTELV